MQKISGKVPIYFLTGDYDFACTPEMTERTAQKVAGSECIIFSGGHFPTSEDPEKFRNVVSPVLKKIIQNDPEKRAGGGQSGRGHVVEMRSSGREDRTAGERRVIEF